MRGFSCHCVILLMPAPDLSLSVVAGKTGD
jgi:hypothetical protein